MTMPFGTYITPNRVTGAAAVFWSAVSGGTIASRSGSASDAPRPLSNARRGIAFLVISMAFLGRSAGLQARREAGLKACTTSDYFWLMVNGVLVATPTMIDDQR